MLNRFKLSSTGILISGVLLAPIRLKNKHAGAFDCENQSKVGVQRESGSSTVKLLLGDQHTGTTKDLLPGSGGLPIVAASCYQNYRKYWKLTQLNCPSKLGQFKPRARSKKSTENLKNELHQRVWLAFLRVHKERSRTLCEQSELHKFKWCWELPSRKEVHNLAKRRFNT